MYNNENQFILNQNLTENMNIQKNRKMKMIINENKQLFIC
jgi:hypothetical protein